MKKLKCCEYGAWPLAAHFHIPRISPAKNKETETRARAFKTRQQQGRVARSRGRLVRGLGEPILALRCKSGKIFSAQTAVTQSQKLCVLIIMSK